MKTLLGTELDYTEQRKAFASFVHRFTRQHVPQWAKKEWKDGKPYPLQFDSDADWLAHTRFHVTSGGKLSESNDFCESSPTWPDNPELRREDF